MKTFYWKRINRPTQYFAFSTAQETIGQLTFDRDWNIRAAFTDKQYSLNFAPKSFWNSDILIIKDGKTLGEIRSKLFGEQILQLATGEKFIIATDFWEQKIYLKIMQDEILIEYRQAKMSSMEQGELTLHKTLTSDMEKLLISAGFVARQAARRRISRAAAAMLPAIVAAASQL